jgi:hypothetical protein
VDAKRPLSTRARTRASTAALARIACRRVFDSQRRALGHPAGFSGLNARSAEGKNEIFGPHPPPPVLHKCSF